MKNYLKHLRARTQIAISRASALTRQAFVIEEEHGPARADLTPLEARVMLSATPMADPGADPSDPGAALNRSHGAQSRMNSQVEIVFLDNSIENADAFLQDLRGNFESGRNLEFAIIDGSLDGLDQMAAYLGGRSDIGAIHILAEGQEDGLRIGTSTLTAESVADHGKVFSEFRSAMSEHGDLLLYGSDIARGSSDLVHALSKMIEVDVAASNNITGSTQQGGDWDLEVHVGEIETATVVSSQMQDQWSGQLSFDTERDFTQALGRQSDDPAASRVIQPNGIDDTANIQAAIDNLREEARNSNETLFVELGPGEYFISDAIRLAPNVGLIGAGMDVTILTATESGKSLWVVKADGAVVQDLTLQASATQTQMVYIDDSENVVFDGVRVTGLTEPEGNVEAMYGIRVRSDSDGFILRNSMIDSFMSESDFSSNSIRALFLVGQGEGLQNVKIVNNVFRDIYSSGGLNTSRDADGIFVAGYSTGVDVLIEGNTFENAGAKRGIKDKVGGLHIINNTMIWDNERAPEGILNPSVAIALQNSVEEGVYSTIENNTIRVINGGFLKAVFVLGVNGVDTPVINGAKIVGNTIDVPIEMDARTSNMDGIAIGNSLAENIVITSNNFYGAYRWGINGQGIGSLDYSDTNFEFASRGEIQRVLMQQNVHFTGNNNDDDDELTTIEF